MRKIYQKGFTLIELLIVIAIIGILAAVLIPNLLSARQKAVDTAIKADLKSIQTTAAIYYPANDSSYTGVCGTGPGAIGDMVLEAAEKYIGPTATVGDSAFGDFVYGDINFGAICHEDATGWAVIISLKNPTNSSAGWCVDYTGQAQESLYLYSSSYTSSLPDIICQ